MSATTVLRWLGLDAGHAHRENAERLALAVHDELLPATPVVCTHVIRGDGGHYAVSFAVGADVALDVVGPAVGTLAGESGLALVGPHEGSVRGPEPYRPGALQAAITHRDRKGGRALRFPGQERLRGRLTVAEIVAASAVECVPGLGMTTGDDTVVDIRDFIRPVYTEGRLALLVTPGAGEVAVPFEIEGAHAC